MLFCVELSDFRIIYNVLKAISFREYAIIRPMEEGLKVTLEEMKCTETSAYIPSSIFSSYRIDSTEEIIFKISLKIFTEILNIFGDEGNPSLKLYYKTNGSPLSIVMKHNEENITVDCEIRTMNVEDFDDISLADECNLSKIVINANLFVELLQRSDNSADDVKFTFSPDPPYFTITTTGVAGEAEVSVSKNSESVTIFQCSKTISSVYTLSNLRHIFKVMNYADKVAISTGESGLLGLQLVINSDDRQMYIENYVTSQFAVEK